MLIDGKTRFETSCPARWRLAARLVTASAVAAASLLTLRPAAVADDPAPQAPGKVEPVANPLIRVLGPDGKPFAGAKVSATSSPSVAIGETGPDGSIRVPDPEVGYFATAEGFGIALAGQAAREDLTVRLVRDDVPIRGRVVDAEGRPVAGAVVQVSAIAWNPGGDLDRLIEGLRIKKDPTPGPPAAATHIWHIRSFLPPVVADRDGRFTVRGIGRERIARLRISGEGIETAFMQVATREMPTVEVPMIVSAPDGPKVTYRGATLEHAARPGREVVGTVTDADTGEPVPRAVVGLDFAEPESHPLFERNGPLAESVPMFGPSPHPAHGVDFRTTTDPQGRYRLSGLPARPVGFRGPGDGSELVAGRDGDPPYLPAGKTLGEGDPSEPAVVDFALRRAVRVKGRVVDRETGRGVRSVVSYFVLAGNPNLALKPQSFASHPGGPTTDIDGNFELFAHPGPGALAARAHGRDFVYDDKGMPYRRGAGVDSIPGLKWKEGQSGVVDTLTDIFTPYDYQAVAGIDPKPGETEATCTLFVERGPAVKGRVVGPDGEPLAGAILLGASDYLLAGSRKPEASAEFVVEKLVPNAVRDVMGFLPEKKLAGAIKVAPDEAGPVVLKLEPHGVVVGRLVDAEGRPVPNWEILRGTPWDRDGGQPDGVLIAGPPKTDGEGRFRIEGLIPGRKYRFHVWRADPARKLGPPARLIPLGGELAVASGETRDVGDVNHDGPGIE